MTSGIIPAAIAPGTHCCQQTSGLPAHLQSRRPAYTGLQEPRMDSAVSMALEGSGLRLLFWDAAPIGPRFRLRMMGLHVSGSETGAEWLRISECLDTSDQLFSSLLPIPDSPIRQDQRQCLPLQSDTPSLCNSILCIVQLNLRSLHNLIHLTLQYEVLYFPRLFVY